MASEGADVLDVGVLPTPGVAFLAAQRACPAAMVSASHNLFADNGIKLFAAGGLKLPDAIEASVEEELAQVLATVRRSRSRPGPRRGPPVAARPTPPAPTRRAPAVDAFEGRDLRGVRVVVDCANGAAWEVAPEALARAGADVTAIAVEPDGANINDGCGSTHPEVLAAGGGVAVAPTSGWRSTGTPIACWRWTTPAPS